MMSVAQSPSFDVPSPVLKVENLITTLRTSKGEVNVVDGVSFELYPGETLGLVGESGSGKSLTCLSILRLLPDRIGRIASGHVYYRGEDLVALDEKEMRYRRGRDISIVLQDPMTSLNPVLTIGAQVGEGVALHRKLPRFERLNFVIDLLRRMRIPAPETRVHVYPHEMSGGMRQRVCGAIAISGTPSILIADEPTTALDATIQAQYLGLLRRVQAEENLSILFVTHDFGIVSAMCDRVAVMYAGRIVEIAPVQDLFDRPAHPYTEALLRSVPGMDEVVERLYSIDGQPPPLHDLPRGCSFGPRCAKAEGRCFDAKPPLEELRPGQSVACWKAFPNA